MRFELLNGANKTLNSDKRFAKIELNLEGGGFQDLKELGFHEIEALRTDKYKFNQNDCVYKKDDKYYRLVKYTHFNSHFSGGEEGIYEVYFQEIK
jgi:hypothetical protein